MVEAQQTPKGNVKLKPRRFVIPAPKRLGQEDYGFEARFRLRRNSISNKQDNKQTQNFFFKTTTASLEPSLQSCRPQGRKCSLGELGMREALVSSSNMADKQSKTETHGFIEKPLMQNSSASFQDMDTVTE